MNTGSTPNVVRGTSGNRNASVNGTTYGWMGFHYQETDQASKTVEPDGSTVVNVYFDRDEITIEFWTYRNSGGCTGACDQGNYRPDSSLTLKGLYGAPIDPADWPSQYAWTERIEGRDTQLTFLAAFLPADGSNYVRLYGAEPGRYKTTIDFYKEKADGSGYELANSVTAAKESPYGDAEFSITEK